MVAPKASASSSLIADASAVTVAAAGSVGKPCIFAADERCSAICKGLSTVIIVEAEEEEEGVAMALIGEVTVAT